MRVVVVVTALVLAACAGGDATSTRGTPESLETTTTSSTEATTTAPSTASTVTTMGAEGTPDTRPAPNPDRPLAPDFSLTLGDGTVYEYASEVRPVFMVFWAEW